MLELFGFKKTTHVGISLSANNFIELVCIDKLTRTIVRYASGNVKYNNAIKEIIDYDEFKDVVESLFDEAGLDPNQCAVTVSIPNVHFDITTLENSSDTPFILENLQADIEDLYIFKRNEPNISYVTLDGQVGKNQQNIVYGAVQAKVVGRLIEIFETMGATLVRIESSYSAMLKAIQFNTKYQDLVQKEEQTLILLITQSSCASFFMNGNIVVDYTEEPLAVKSFSPEEVHVMLSKAAENAISKNNPKSLLIISETDDVNAELLSQRIDFAGDKQSINKSVDVNDAFMDVSSVEADIDPNAIPYITMEAVGAAVSDYDEYPLDINFLPAERLRSNIVEAFGYEVDFMRLVLFCVVLALLIGAIIGGIIYFLLNMQISNMTETSDDARREIMAFQQKLNKTGKGPQKDMLPTLTKILENNKNVIAVYTALSTDIPEAIYIKKFVTNEAGAIGILGEAKTSESVERFVNNLKEKDSSLMLSKLSVNTKFDPIPAKIPDGFTFEIKSNGQDISLQDDILLQPTGIPNMYDNSVPAVVPQLPQPSTPSQGGALPPPSPII